MVKNSPHRRPPQSGITSSDSSNPSNNSCGGYQAPTSGYENVLYSHRATYSAVFFGMVNAKLAHYDSVQSWSGATITGKAMDRLAGPALTEPNAISFFSR